VLSVFAQVDYAVSLHKVVPRSCFFPVPKVESAIVVLTRRPRAAHIADEPAFRALVKHCFEHRRKQLGTLVRNPDAIARAGLNPQQRPETLAVGDWIRLAAEVGN
jgi:16S rRNA (adenine1518-N6/adenine1519-N6)-dimethyltransferase